MLTPKQVDKGIQYVSSPISVEDPAPNKVVENEELSSVNSVEFSPLKDEEPSLVKEVEPSLVKDDEPNPVKDIEPSPVKDVEPSLVKVVEPSSAKDAESTFEKEVEPSMKDVKSSLEEEEGKIRKLQLVTEIENLKAKLSTDNSKLIEVSLFCLCLFFFNSGTRLLFGHDLPLAVSNV